MRLKGQQSKLSLRLAPPPPLGVKGMYSIEGTLSKIKRSG